MDYPIAVKTVQLERLKFIIEKRISSELLGLIDADNIEVRYSLFDSIADDVAIRVRAVIFGEKLNTEITRHPADWWQAFKARWFPAWAKKRWPVVMTTADVYALYAGISLPQYHRGGFMVRTNEPLKWKDGEADY